jgi:hypothetical protein
MHTDVGKRGPQPKPEKARRKVLSVAVSPEDYDVIRSLLGADETISSWIYDAVKARIEKESGAPKKRTR